MSSFKKLLDAQKKKEKPKDNANDILKEIRNEKAIETIDTYGGIPIEILDKGVDIVKEELLSSKPKETPKPKPKPQPKKQKEKSQEIIENEMDMNKRMESLAKSIDFKRFLYRTITGISHRGTKNQLNASLRAKLKKLDSHKSK